MRRYFLLLTLLLPGMLTVSLAQTKIGYLNLEAVLAYMPETKRINQQLQSFEQKLAEDLNNRQTYAQTLLTEYQEYTSTLDPNNLTSEQETELQNKQKKLQELDQEIQKKNAEAQQKLAAKQQELMAPVLDKLQKAIDAYAEEHNYTYILNSSSNGYSIMLHGAEQDNLSEPILAKMGVTVPKEAKQ